MKQVTCQPIKDSDPRVLAASEVFDLEGRILGRVEHRETTVMDIRKGRVMGQKPATRWFAAKPGEPVISYRDTKYRTEMEAALSLLEKP